MIQIEEISSMILETRYERRSFWYLAGYESIIVSRQNWTTDPPGAPINQKWYKMGQEDALGDFNAQT